MRTHQPSPPQRQSWNGQAMASPLTMPRLRSPPMCRQNASSTCRRSAESAKTTSFVPNAATACGPGSRNELASPRQCQPRANLAGGTPVSMVRTPSPSLMQGLHASSTCLQQVIESFCHLLYCPRSDTLTDRLEHVLVLWRWPTVYGRNQGGHPVTENVGQAVVDRVRELLPTLRERAQQAEDARVVPAESIKALEEAGHFRLLQPARFGGDEADPP